MFELVCDLWVESFLLMRRHHEGGSMGSERRSPLRSDCPSSRKLRGQAAIHYFGVRDPGAQAPVLLDPRETTMNLLVRINLALVIIFVLGALITGVACRAVLQANAEREIVAQAGLMMDSALAIRDYTEEEILPLLHAQMQNEFLPQSVPFYAATQNFLRLHRAHPQYSYKEATLNPTNPRDRAADWEADIIQRFRNDASRARVRRRARYPDGPVAVPGQAHPRRGRVPVLPQSAGRRAAAP